MTVPSRILRFGGVRRLLAKQHSPTSPLSLVSTAISTYTAHYIYKRTAPCVRVSACPRLVSALSSADGPFCGRFLSFLRRFLFACGQFLSLWCKTANFCPDARAEREGRVQIGWNLIADFRHFIFCYYSYPTKWVASAKRWSLHKTVK